jgi:hypothetical protein
MKISDAKTIYAQSSDIKGRDYLQYRKDMKRKAIAELEIVEWLQKKMQEIFPGKTVTVSKAGGDKFIWFLRKGGVSRAGDFIAKVDEKELEIEFQYAAKEGLEYYDFKTSKVAKKKGKELVPIKDKLFIYIHKPLLKWAILSPEWLMENGKREEVPAWRCEAFRVPQEKFVAELKDDQELKEICHRIDVKNYILDFQHQLIEKTKEKLSSALQSVVDDRRILRIVPNDLESFFKVCFILDNIGKFPKNGNIWLVYVLSYAGTCDTLEEISKVVYCIDFLYSQLHLEPNELKELVAKIKQILGKIKGARRADGAYVSSLEASPLEETRYALFSINLLEDLVQDLVVNYSCAELEPVRKIYQNAGEIEKTYRLITGERRVPS